MPALRGHENTASPVVIRHANLETVYNHLLSKSDEARALAEKRTGLEKRKETLLSQPTPAADPALTSDFADLENREKELKSALYKKINVAVKRVALRQGVDYVLDSSRTLIYYPSKWDLTDDIISEMDILDIRSEPVSR